MIRTAACSVPATHVRACLSSTGPVVLLPMDRTAIPDGWNLAIDGPPISTILIRPGFFLGASGHDPARARGWP